MIGVLHGRLPSPHLRARRFTPAGFYPPKLYIQCPGPNCHPAEPVVRSRLTPPERHVMRPLALPAPSGTPSGRGFSLVAFVRLTAKRVAGAVPGHGPARNG